jgi:dTDP-4-amino-4,6-dideoxygalactose transaminase
MDLSPGNEWVTLIGADWRVQDVPRAVLGFVNQRRAILRLEDFLGRFMGVSVCATELGRTALRLGLAALGLGRGDGVIVPALVCPTVVNAIIMAGCRPVFSDVAPGKLTLTVDELAPLLTSGVHAVLVPHIYCLNAPMEEIETLCREKGVFLIDDAAQSFGMRSGGRYLGTFGDVGILSFGPFKGIAALRGGALVSRDREIINKVRTHGFAEERVLSSLRRCVSGYRRYFLRAGYLEKRFNRTGPLNGKKNASPEISAYVGEYELSGFDATLTRLTVERYENILKSRSLSAERVFRALGNNAIFDFIGPPDSPYVKIPVRLNHQYRAREVVRCLRNLKIDAEQIYVPAHLCPSFKQYAGEKYPNAEQDRMQVFLLPNPYNKGAPALNHLVRAAEELSRTL